MEDEVSDGENIYGWSIGNDNIIKMKWYKNGEWQLKKRWWGGENRIRKKDREEIRERLKEKNGGRIGNSIRYCDGDIIEDMIMDKWKRFIMKK